MNKHIICYPILVLTIAILAGQISSPKNNDVHLSEPKTVILEPEDYKSTKRELKKLKTELEKKEKLISNLNTRLNDKDSEIEKIKLAKANEIQPDKKENKNPLADILSSASRMTESPRIKEMMKKRMLKRYASLFDKLNLSDEKREQLAQLLMDRSKEKQEKLMSLFSGNKPGESMNPEDFKALNGKTDTDQEIEALLGSDYSEFEYYEKTAYERRQLSDISNSLSEQDKLSGDQEDQMVKLLKQRNDDLRAGDKKTNEEYVAESSEFLNDNQQEEFSKSLKRNKNRFSALPFINGGGGNVQIIESIEVE